MPLLRETEEKHKRFGVGGGGSTMGLSQRGASKVVLFPLASFRIGFFSKLPETGTLKRQM